MFPHVRFKLSLKLYLLTWNSEHKKLNSGEKPKKLLCAGFTNTSEIGP